MTTQTNVTRTIERGDLTGDYVIDPNHSRFGFVARHAMVTKVRGQFNQFEGTLHLDGNDPSASYGELTIEVASIDTRNQDRDAHIRSNDFLALDQYPQIHFKTTRIEGEGDQFNVIGDLSVRGVTRPVALDVNVIGSTIDPWGNTRVGFEGATSINRKDWGVNWNAVLEAGGVLVSEKVTLEFEIAAIKK